MGSNRDVSICPACRSPIRVRLKDVRGQTFACPACNAALVERDGHLATELSPTTRSFPWLTAGLIAVVISSVVTLIVTNTPETVAVKQRVAASKPDTTPPPSEPFVDAGPKLSGPIINKSPTTEPPTVEPPETVVWPDDLPEPPPQPVAFPPPQLSEDRPITVTLTPWSVEDDPIEPTVVDLLADRTATKLARVVPRVESDQSVTIAEVVNTLTELAGVSLTPNVALPNDPITVRATDQTIASILTDVLARAGYRYEITAEGFVQVLGP